MESSRGGPLTTFIMMLPLIVVPTIAMLKPIGQQGNLLSSLLSAAPQTDNAAQSETEESVIDALPGHEFDVEFGQFPASAADDEFAELNDALFAEAAQTPAANYSTMESDTSFGDHSMRGANAIEDRLTATTRDTESLLDQLQQMGATRTMWFSPGNSQVGFIAFFQSGRGIISYRFESIAMSRAAAVQDVMSQARSWLASRTQ